MRFSLAALERPIMAWRKCHCPPIVRDRSIADYISGPQIILTWTSGRNATQCVCYWACSWYSETLGNKVTCMPHIRSMVSFLFRSLENPRQELSGVEQLVPAPSFLGFHFSSSSHTWPSLKSRILAAANPACGNVLPLCVKPCSPPRVFCKTLGSESWNKHVEMQIRGSNLRPIESQYL